MLSEAALAAPLAVSVLLTGPTGTGKSQLARLIHDNSPRRRGPFVDVNCAMLEDNLLQSELFGHVRGAFTGATTDREGRVRSAAGGTLLLDEIDTLSPSAQAKLLQLLQERTFSRLGDDRVHKTDVRIIAATNQDLEKLIEAKRFRQDLFYRLNIITFNIPPLRERREDIPALAEHFLRNFANEFRKPVPSLSEAAARKLSAYDWPGNVRELRNVVERAVLLAEGPVIQDQDLRMGGADRRREADRLVARLLDGGLRLEEIERAAVVEALERAAGNRTRAGELLGVSRDRIRLRMIKFGLLDRKPEPEGGVS
jgi:two-component system response regulator HydG